LLDRSVAEQEEVEEVPDQKCGRREFNGRQAARVTGSERASNRQPTASAWEVGRE
jgi:hypothetical protein